MINITAQRDKKKLEDDISNILTEIEENDRTIILDQGENSTDPDQDQHTVTVLKKQENIDTHGHSIRRIVSSFWFVRDTTVINELADELNVRDQIFAVGVVDKNHTVLGVITRKDLFDLLSKPFGRDVLKKRTVKEVVQIVRTFNFNRNIFSVSEEIEADMNSQKTIYYVLTNWQNQYRGIFSTKDMLLYLSNTTRMDIAASQKLQSRIVNAETRQSCREFEMIGISNMARGVGGDYYYAQSYAPMKWLFSVCDVSGKGISASFITALLWGMFRMYNFSSGIGRFLKKINQIILETFQSEKFVTGMFLDMDVSTGEIVLCDMGHSYIWIYRNGKFLKVQTSGNNPPLGVLGNLTPELNKFSMQQNDILLVFTDGIIEQTNPQGEEFGMNRIKSIFTKVDSNDIHEIKDNLIKEYHRFRENQAMHDDLTFILLKYHKQ
ncbi:MAG: SpoIIE family protein phosphatase [Spirochaetia bacterium]